MWMDMDTNTDTDTDMDTETDMNPYYIKGEMSESII